MQLKGLCAIKRALVPVAGPYGDICSSCRPSVPLIKAPLIVGHSPGFNCIGSRGACKNIGLGRT